MLRFKIDTLPRLINHECNVSQWSTTRIITRKQARSHRREIATNDKFRIKI